MPNPDVSHISAKRVLIVDDDEMLCGILSQLLTHLGYMAWCAHSASAALEIWGKESKSISCVFTDVMMPGMDGLSLARKLRKDAPKIPILLLSGYINDDSRWVVGEDDFGFLQKPFTLEELKRVMSVLAEPA
ncbi:MAG TPA: response regulator [Rariglobus sp.]|jgi:two-component system cell cycle sensor histidine kinase/response regulator CckA|nr:response regulator [Rariglobus sp.]